MVYLVLFKNKKLGDYKYYSLSIITFAYLFEFLLAVCQPVFIFPALGGYAKGLIRKTSSTVAFVCLALIMLCVGYTLIGIFHVMLFRYKVIAPEWIKKWVEVKWFYYGTIAYGYLGITVGACFWLFFLRPNKKKLDAFISANPEYADLATKEPTLIIFNAEEFLPSNVFFIDYFIIVALVVVTLTLIFHLENRLYKQKSKMCAKTFKLQKMMNAYFKAELLSAHLFLLCPITTGIIMMHTKNPNGATISHIALMFGSLYSIFLYSSMIYFIKPYRLCLAKLFCIGIRSRVTNFQRSRFME